jgi:hypothetical protein
MSRDGISLEGSSGPEQFKLITVFLKGILCPFPSFQIFPGKLTEGNPKCTSGTYVTLNSKTKAFEIDPKTLFEIQMNYRPTVK